MVEKRGNNERLRRDLRFCELIIYTLRCQLHAKIVKNIYSHKITIEIRILLIAEMDYFSRRINNWEASKRGRVTI